MSDTNVTIRRAVRLSDRTRSYRSLPFHSTANPAADDIKPLQTVTVEHIPEEGNLDWDGREMCCSSVKLTTIDADGTTVVLTYPKDWFLNMIEHWAELIKEWP